MNSANLLRRVSLMVPQGLMALAVFFFLTPGYEHTGLIYAAASAALSAKELFSPSNTTMIKWAIVIIAAVCLGISLFIQNTVLRTHLLELSFGIFVGMSTYGSIKMNHTPVHYTIAILALPFAAHLLFFLPKIPMHMLGTPEASWLYKFESLRTNIQIGAKLFGQALVLLIPCSYYLLCLAERTYETFAVRIVFVLACITLALIDSRAAFLSLAVGIACAIYTNYRMQKQTHHSIEYDELARRAKKFRRFVLLIAMICTMLAVSVGWHRISRVDAALQAAINRASYSSWITPSTWLKEFCPNQNQECLVENSIYLRTSWILFGTQRIGLHPWRIDPSFAPLERELTDAYPLIARDHPVYTDFHSGIIDVGTNYGILGIIGFILLLFAPLYALLKRTGKENAPDYLPLLACLWATCITRALIDGVGIYLWYTFWAMGGYVLALMRERRLMLRHAV